MGNSIPMKFLVTGGSGFLGSHLANRLTALGKVTVLDDFSTGRAENLAGIGGVEIAEGSVTDGNTVSRAAAGAEIIFHLAAQVSVPQSFKEPEKTMEVNVQGTLNVLEAARKNDARVVYSSSCAVYGSTKPPLRENSQLNPLSPYAESKLLAEKHLQNYAKEHGLEAVALRYFNIYGPRQRPDSQYAAAIPKMVDAILHGQAPTVYGDGEQTRDFVNVKDVVQANLLAAKKKEATDGAFNIGSGEATSINQLILLLEKITERKANPKHESAREGDIKHSWADISRARQVLGFEPKVKLENGLQETVAWLRARK